MTISDHDRRVLWARAGNSCALCKAPLVLPATTDDRESIIGEEAHIVARSHSGPRGGFLPDEELDKYDNLILLCRNDHRRVDNQSLEFTAEALRTLKEEHEKWVAERVGRSDSGDSQPIRLIPDPAQPVRAHLTLLISGDQLWRVIAHNHAYRFVTVPEDGKATQDQCDASDAFLDLVKDWGEISEEIELQGMTSIRDTKRSLGEALVDLARHGLVALGGRHRLRMEGGIGPPSDWLEAVVAVFRADDPILHQRETEDTNASQ
jgi:hypothetical protein